jgi:hypothetical protein
MRSYLLRIIGIGTIFAILMLSMVSSVSAEDVPITLEGVYTIDGGSTDDVVVSGNYAYVINTDNGLLIVDVSTPSAPTLAGSYYGNSLPYGVAVSGSYAYVLAGTSLEIVDISDPKSPTLEASYARTTYASNIVVSGSYAYITSSKGLEIVDISDPKSPAFAGSFDDILYMGDVEVSGSYVYSISADNLVIIDVSNPKSPAFAGSFDVSGDRSDTHGVAVLGDYAYVVQDFHDNNDPASSGRLVIVDVRNPKLPAFVGSCVLYDFAFDAVVSGGYAYIACEGGGVVIVDVSKPYEPTLAGGSNAVVIAFDITISEGYLYIADPATNGIFIFKIPDLNGAPEILSLYSPADPIAVNEPVPISAEFIDDGVLDHTATINWGDGSTDTVYPVDGFSISENHPYTTAGVYTITLTVTDGAGESDTKTSEQYVVVYDPEGGFVTGGGWIESPAGAYSDDPELTGKATFGFVSKYKKGATVPTGNTEFQFHVADLNFKSTSYDWLVIAGSKAMYKGTGTINGVGEYKFMLTAIDGSPDKFRIKIWEDDETTPIYDNQNSNDADLTTAIGGGSIIVHK